MQYNGKEIKPSKFIQVLTKSQLSEFLCRVATDYNMPSVLSTMIMNELHTQHSNIFKQHSGLRIWTSVQESPHYKNPSDIYAIIKFTNKQMVTQTLQTGKVYTKHVDAPIGHITFHLICNQCGSNVGRGPFHAINDRSTRKVQTIHVLGKQTNQCCKYTLTLKDESRSDLALKEDMQILSTATLNVINTWFEHIHPQNLSEPMCSQNVIKDTEQYLEAIVEWKTKHGGVLRKRQTRKRKN